MNKKYKNLLVSALSLGILFNFQTTCIAKEKTSPVKEEQEAVKVLPESIETNEETSYDKSHMVKSIEISGNNLVGNNIVIDNMKTKVGSYFNRDEIQNDLKNIYNIGYFTEKIKAVPEAGTDGIKLRIVVEENAPVTGINVSGNTKVLTEDIMKIFDKQTGKPQNICELNKAVEDLEKLYSDKGYLLARVSKLSDDPDGMINIDVNEGVLDGINIKGNVKTKDYVIKRNILTSTGTVYNENVLKQDLSRIYGTQAFADVRRVITPSTQNPNKYNLTIEVDEKKSGTISLGGGIDTGTGLFGTLGYSENNFLGKGQKLSASLMTGTGRVINEFDTARSANVQVEFNFSEPRLLGSLNSFDTSLFVRDYPSFHVPLSTERRIGLALDLSRPVKDIPNLAAGIGLGIEKVSVKEADFSRISDIFAQKNYDIAKRTGQLNGGTFVSLGPTLAYDTRNRLSNTTDGWYLSADVKEFASISGAAGSYGRMALKGRRFIPVGQNSTLMLSGKIGANLIGDMPDFASFRLGGASSIRGFREGDVGIGKGLLFASAEYRTPIPFIDKMTKINFFKDMRLAAFLDSGRVFDEYLSNELFGRPGYGISAGAGLRINMPGVGPIKLDYGIPLTTMGDGISRTPRWTIDFGDRF